MHVIDETDERAAYVSCVLVIHPLLRRPQCYGWEAACFWLEKPISEIL